jgi:hypothetical protein
MLAYLRDTIDDRAISLTQLAEEVAMSPGFLAGAVWGDVELTPTDTARLVQALDCATEVPMAECPRGQLLLVDCHWSGQVDSHAPEAAWPSAVAKEGSD